MSPDKVLHKIQVQIKDIVPSLEFFIEHSIQPTVDECENLQKQLHRLQEDLIIYRYLRENKELSPSFNIHARVSEVEVNPEKKPEQSPEPSAHETPAVKTEIKELIIESVRTEPVIPPRQIAVGINDKFRFINELFAQNAAEYAIAVEQLNTLVNWHDAEIYLNSLKSLYNWKDTSEIVQHYYAVVKKRFA